MDKNKKLVAVYGSLRRDLHNHGLLDGCKFVGEEWSPKGYKMIDLGSFPGIVKDKTSDKVLLELYEVDPYIEKRLDWLEGYVGPNNLNNFYNKGVIATTLGEAIIYLYNCPISDNSDIVADGDWKNYYYSINNYENKES